ncbi:arylesterase [Marinobacter nanhaiticus D15-8W]|uniref:Arylesterase n=1 Tax=Marinobacter nanhaiticus D15-8W TaxID=626887 RepID=N6VZA7_9GAMM|nr:arylesterase [Marinobacter nanhaiticus]ENO15620.1 arylesterase [Marinobacter nanhaiticus D15-8W]BES73530.1 arylesterase [Marinobacter nanhaiticus D15-8W]
MKHSIIPIFLSLFLIACTEPRFDPVFEDGVILAFGDSLTEGVGVAEEESYPSVLAGLSGVRIINAGLSGETTAEGLARLPSVLDRTQPDLMILLEGGNDILRNHDLTATRDNLARMVEMAQSRDIDVLLVGVPEKKLFSDTAPLYAELAERYELAFDDDVVASLLRDPNMKSDSVHFNAEGYQRLAERLYQRLQDEGAL